MPWEAVTCLTTISMTGNIHVVIIYRGDFEGCMRQSEKRVVLEYA